jgi:hypothetical protein
MRIAATIRTLTPLNFCSLSLVGDWTKHWDLESDCWRPSFVHGIVILPNHIGVSTRGLVLAVQILVMSEKATDDDDHHNAVARKLMAST